MSFGVPFKLIGIHVDHFKNKIKIFQVFAFPIGYTGCLRAKVMVGFEDPLHFFFSKGYICSRGVKWNMFDHFQFEIKTFHIYVSPNV